MRWVFICAGMLLIGLLLALPVLWSPPVFVDVGGFAQPRKADPLIYDRYIEDAPFVRAAHAPEPDTLLDATQTTYRWLMPQAGVYVPAVGSSTLLVTLRVLPPPLASVPLTLAVDGAALNASLPPEPRVIRWFVPRSAAQDFKATVASRPFVAPGDQRELGIALDLLIVQPLSRWPFAGYTWLLAVAVVLIVGCAVKASGFRYSSAVAGSGAVTALLVYGLVMHRQVVAFGLARWLVVALSGCLTIVVWRVWSARWGDFSPSMHQAITRLIALTALAWGIRMVGLWHPQANHSDVPLHVHNLVAVMQGELFFTEGLPAEAGGGQSPYPPLLYILIQPFMLLWPDPAAWLVVLLALVALLDALIVPLLWWAIFDPAAPQQQRWAWWSAALYLVPLTALRSLTIGELTNVGGQTIGVLALLACVLWLRRAGSWRTGVLVLALFGLAALSHVGVLVALGLSGTLWALGLLVARQWNALRSLVAVGGGALLLFAVLYVSAFIGDAPFQNAAAVSLPALALSTKLWITLQAHVLHWNADTFIGWWGAALAGWLLVRRQGSRWTLPLAAWLAAAPVAWLSLVWSAQTIRWWLWVLPALCIAVGALLTLLYSRRPWLAAMVWLVFQLHALAAWLAFIAAYRTGNFIP